MVRCVGEWGDKNVTNNPHVQGLRDLTTEEVAALAALGWKQEEVCYCTVSYKWDDGSGDEVWPGLKGEVTGLSDEGGADGCVEVRFENGVRVDMDSKTHIARNPEA